MITDAQKEYVINKLHEKGIGIKTQEYVLEYLEVNAKLYANIIPIKDIIERIINNLNDNIKYKHSILHTGGYYDSKAKEIIIYKDTKKKEKRMIFHEMDHMATTSKDNLKDINRPKNEVVGGLDYCMSLNGGKSVNFEVLNEGITEYKVKKYILYQTSDKRKAKNYKYMQSTEYYNYTEVVSKLIEIIGEDTVIKDQFYGDICDLERKFEEQVQWNYTLFEIVADMNEAFKGINLIKRMKAKKRLNEKLEKAKLIKKCTDLGVDLDGEEIDEKVLKDIIRSNEKRNKTRKKTEFVQKINIPQIVNVYPNTYKDKIQELEI